MSIHLIHETHSISRDKEAEIATGPLPGELSEHGRLGAQNLGRRRADSTGVIWLR
jgi:hypothetical protein